MATESDYELVLSNPWRIEFPWDDSQASSDLISAITEKTAGLTISGQNASEQPKSPVSWSEHETLTGEVLNEAAQRVAAETFKNICVHHPTQSHRPSEDTPGKGIRPDYIVAWSCNGVRKNTAVVDAKDYHGNIPRKEYEKICRDMSATKATRGILVLGPGASISDKLRADIEKENKVDIVQIKNNRVDAVREITQYIGKIIDKNFVANDKRFEAYRRYVDSPDKSQERRPNRHGENDTYTTNSNYHRFKHPRKEDGTLDERFEANRDRNKDGGPDMRMAHNKTTQAQQQHLNKDGLNDMRSAEHREQLVDKTGHHLNVDGTPDKRCKENQEGVNTSSANKPLPVTSQVVAEATDTEIPTKTDGTADLRYTTSKDAVASGTIEPDEKLTEGGDAMSSGLNQELSGSASADIPTKSDGTADMRFSASQEAVTSGEISRDEVLSGGNEGSIGETDESSSGMMGDVGGGGDGPPKADGTPDMRFSANQEAVTSGEISRDEVLSGGNEGSIGETVESSSGMMGDVGGGGGGPSKADGTPDMRFSANQ